MKIYVAGSSKVSDRCKYIGEKLNSKGMILTCPWWEEFGEKLGPLELLNTSPYQIAQRDLDGVDSADVVLVHLIPSASSQGLWVELGYALALSKYVVVLVEADEFNKQELVEWLRKAVFLFSPGVDRIFFELNKCLEHLDGLTIFDPHKETEIPF